MPRISDKCRLLHGPYRSPRLHVGDRAECLQRGTVVIKSWTDARISWPGVCPLPARDTPACFLTNQPTRAVCTETKAAVGFWWGALTVWRGDGERL
jgi:hypothetical protein